MQGQSQRLCLGDKVGESIAGCFWSSQVSFEEFCENCIDSGLSSCGDGRKPDAQSMLKDGQDVGVEHLKDQRERERCQMKFRKKKAHSGRCFVTEGFSMGGEF